MTAKKQSNSKTSKKVESSKKTSSLKKGSFNKKGSGFKKKTSAVSASSSKSRYGKSKSGKSKYDSSSKSKFSKKSFIDFFSSLSFSSKLLKIIGIVLVVLLLVLSISYFFGVKMKFMADNELYISLDPLDYSLSSENSGLQSVNFSVSVNRPVVCETTCNFSLFDESSGSLISSQSRFDFNSESFTFDIPVPSIGEGQSLFNFKVACYNERTSLCSSQERVFYKNSLITLDYNLSDSNLVLEGQSRTLLDSFLSDLSIVESNIFESNFYIGALNYSSNSSNVFSEELVLSSNLSSMNNSFNSFLVVRDSLLSSWKDFDFNSIISVVNSNSQDLSDLLSSSNDLKSSSSDIYFKLNSSIDSINSFYSKESSLFDAKKFFTMVNDSSSLSQLSQLESDVDVFIQDVSVKNFSSVQEMFDRSVVLLTDSDNLISSYRSQQNDLVSILEKQYTSLSDLRFYLSNGFFPLLSIPSNPSLIQRISFNSGCINLGQEISNVSSHNVFAQQQKESLYPYMNNSVLLSQASEEFVDYVLDKRLSPSLIFTLNSSIYDNAPSDYPYTNASGTFTTFNITSINEDDFRLISKINVSRLTNDSYDKFCLWALPVSLVNLMNISVPVIDSFSSALFSSNFNYSIPPLVPICSYDGDGDTCCQGNECDDSYPVILVHGHSFDKANSPELAFTRLSLLQNSLEDIGYINAGTLSLDSGIGSMDFGSWGKNKHPISILVTYYYITHSDVGGVEFTTRKTDSIENYAIRLKEMIDVVKHRTGKDKVIIVAHSMGGLVSREYISLFGGSDVVKLITLGTPNHGIEGDVKKYCSVTGGKKECDDMNFDSVFMSRLNSPSSTPQFTDVYTVTAHGCLMKNEDGDKEDGDGVVLARNVPLSFATNYDVNGTCTDFLQSNLHMKFVEPNLYPETFEIVKSILTS